MSKRLELRNERIIRDLIRLSENKLCFECRSQYPTYVNLFNNTFVCTQCSGLLRTLNHRVKSISASTFSFDEVKNLQNGGNTKAACVWMARRINQSIPTELEELKKFIYDKYVNRKWLVDEATLNYRFRSIESLRSGSTSSSDSLPSPALRSTSTLSEASVISPRLSPIESKKNSDVPLLPMGLPRDENFKLPSIVQSNSDLFEYIPESKPSPIFSSQSRASTMPLSLKRSPTTRRRTSKLPTSSHFNTISTPSLQRQPISSATFTPDSTINPSNRPNTNQPSPKIDLLTSDLFPCDIPFSGPFSSPKYP